MPVLEMPVEEKLMTADEFFQSPLSATHELIEGKAVFVAPVGFEHGDSAVDIAGYLRAFVRQRKLGSVVVEVGFVLRRSPDVVRAPDIAFVESSRVPEGRQRKKFVEGAPTLAVEIVSPGDLWSEVEDKVNLYLEAGSAAVWIVEPDAQTVTVRTVDAAPRVWRRNEILQGGAVLPGFELPLAELFEA